MHNQNECACNTDLLQDDYTNKQQQTNKQKHTHQNESVYNADLFQVESTTKTRVPVT